VNDWIEDLVWRVIRRRNRVRKVRYKIRSRMNTTVEMISGLG